MKKMLLFPILLGLALALCPAGYAAAEAPEAPHAAVESQLGPSPEWVAQLPQAQTAEQLLIVARVEGTTAWISLHQKDAAGTWQLRMSTPGFIGKEGLGKTREGDGKTPVGTFGFNAAFGIAEDPGCAIPYTQVGEEHYWSGDEREGMHYNELVSIRDLPELDLGVSEHLIDCTREYQYCLNIDYNKEGEPGRGSAIFLHCLGARKPYTGGCVAIPQDQMLAVMRQVSPGCVVLIDTAENLGADLG